MRCLFLVFLSLLSLGSLPVAGQHTYLPPGSREYGLLDRLETKAGVFSNSLFLSQRPLARKDVYRLLTAAKSIGYQAGFTNIDNYRINRGVSLSGEWETLNGNGAQDGLNPVFNLFYNKEAELIHVNRRGLYLSVNPILSFEGRYEKPGRKGMPFETTQGLELRGKLGSRLGFFVQGTHTFDRPVDYRQDWIDRWGRIPGAGAFRAQDGGYSYFRFRGAADVALIREYVSLQAGYNQHFLGDGIRSLFLSDYSEAAAFVGLRTQIWKLQYRNLYLRLQPQFFGGHRPGGYKYATVHHLSVNVLPWLNIGLYESVVFARRGAFEIGYMNPLIFYRALERSMGSPDKVTIGLNAKAVTMRTLQLYSQFMLNEFTAKEFFGGQGYWANKWGLQAGVKYFDALTIPNLDIQAEVNMVRPYTYTHNAKARQEEHITLANFSHYNQPLAHPLGAGFVELIGRIAYRPLPKLLVEGRAMYYQQGSDTGRANFGSNIFMDYNTRSSQYGVQMIHGPTKEVLMLDLRGSYELKPRLYFDLGISYREEFYEHQEEARRESLFFHAGFRLNLERTFEDWY